MGKFVNLKENKIYAIVEYENSKVKIFRANGKVLSKKKIKEILNESFEISTSYSFKIEKYYLKIYTSSETFEKLNEDFFNKDFIFEVSDNNNKKKYLKASTLISKSQTFYVGTEKTGYFSIILIINDEIITPFDYFKNNNLKMEGNFFIIEKEKEEDEEEKKTLNSKNFLELKKENEFIFKK